VGRENAFFKSSPVDEYHLPQMNSEKVFLGCRGSGFMKIYVGVEEDTGYSHMSKNMHKSSISQANRPPSWILPFLGKNAYFFKSMMVFYILSTDLDL
jgi:hypothetical protein